MKNPNTLPGDWWDAPKHECPNCGSPGPFDIGGSPGGPTMFHCPACGVRLELEFDSDQ